MPETKCLEFYQRARGAVWHIVEESIQLRSNQRKLEAYCGNMEYSPPGEVCSQGVVRRANLPICRRCLLAYRRRTL